MSLIVADAVYSSLSPVIYSSVAGLLYSSITAHAQAALADSVMDSSLDCDANPTYLYPYCPSNLDFSNEWDVESPPTARNGMCERVTNFFRQACDSVVSNVKKVKNRLLGTPKKVEVIRSSALNVPTVAPQPVAHTHNITVVCLPSHGHGDINGCIKIFKAIKKLRAGDLIRIATYQIWKDRLSIFANDILNYFSYFPALSHFLKNDHETSLYIDFPINVMEPHLFVSLKKSPTPHLGIFEYGFHKNVSVINKKFADGNVFVQSLGVEEGDLGILFDEELYQIYANQVFSAAERLQNLASLPFDLQESILGSSYSSDAIETFSAQSKLYFGYAAVPLTKILFAEIISRCNSMNWDVDSLVFVLVGTIHPDEDYRPFLGRAGVDNLELYKPNEAGRLAKQTFVLGAGDLNVRLITLPSVNHEHFISLMRASEKIKLSGGDQSTGEVFSMKGVPIYENLFHKEGFSASLMRLLGQDRQLGELAPVLFSHLGPNKDRMRKISKLSLKNYRFFYNFINNSTLQAVWDRFIDRMHSNHNFLTKINPVIDRLLLPQNSKI